MKLRITINRTENKNDRYDPWIYFVSIEEYKERVWNSITVYRGNHHFSAKTIARDIAELCKCEYVELFE